MLSLSQMTPVAYITDGAIVCLACGDKAGLPVKDQLIAYNLESDFYEDGLNCDECGKELVEPYVEDEPDTEYCAEHGEVVPVEDRCPVCEHATSTTMEEAKRFAEQDEDTTPLPLQGTCKDCGNGTLNNELNHAFVEQADGNEEQPYNTYVCKRCGSTHLDIF